MRERIICGVKVTSKDEMGSVLGRNTGGINENVRAYISNKVRTSSREVEVDEDDTSGMSR